VAEVLPVLLCEKLIVHGTADQTMPSSVAQEMYNFAVKGPRYLHLLEGADHTLASHATQIVELLEQFTAYLLGKKKI